MKTFQLPFYQQQLAKNNFQELEKVLLTSSNQGTFTSEDIASYKLAWHDRRHSELHAELVPRSFSAKSKTRKSSQIAIPVMVLWGVNDKFLSKAMAEPCLKYCTKGKVEYIEGATHWVLHEKPEEVNKHIVSFFKE